MLWRYLLLTLFLLVSCLQAQDQSQFWPELDTYVELTPRTRLFFLAALSSDQDTRNLEGQFGANLDFLPSPLSSPKSSR
jgi:hypothetical protein